MSGNVNIVAEVDFRDKPSSCTDNPVIRLKRAVRNLKSGEAVRIIVDLNSTPKRFFEVLARKEKLALEIVGEGETAEVLLVKQ